jgi:hypothetical protein
MGSIGYVCWIRYSTKLVLLSIERQGKVSTPSFCTFAGSVLQRRHDAVVSRMEAEVLEPQQCLAFALKGIRDPAEGVVEVPKSEADAGFSLSTSASGL